MEASRNATAIADDRQSNNDDDDDDDDVDLDEEEKAKREATRNRKRRFHLIRHGVTHMNVYLTKNPYGSRGFRDPLDFDTRLTPRGVEQARSLSTKTAALFSSSNSTSSSSSSFAVVVSPLTRALQTATLAFPFLVDEAAASRGGGGSNNGGNGEGRKKTMTSLALARERVWLSSDVGRRRSEVEPEFPHVCFQDLPQCDSPWWHGGEEAARGQVELEPVRSFRRRVEALREVLLERPEEDVAVVSHASVLEALTGGRFFHNCELVSVTGEELLSVDIVGGDWGEGGDEEEEGEGFLF